MAKCERPGTDDDSLTRALARNPDDPFLRALANAPEDDEPETPEEAAAVAEAKATLARGEFGMLDDIRDQLLGDSPKN